MTELFKKCIDVVLKHEGGYTDNPNDLGNWVGGYKVGRLVGTKYGIAGRYFPDVDIKNLTIEQAKEIYYEYFWKPMRLEGIKDELAVLHIFDYGVNAGRKRSIRTAQRLAGVTADGIIGPVTTKYINNYYGNFANDFAHARRIYYEYIASKRDNYIFLKCWLNRANNTHF